MNAVRLFAVCSALLVSVAADAHDARPNYVEVKEINPDRFLIEWKVPTTVPFVNLPAILVPAECKADVEATTREFPDSYVSRIQYHCPRGLSGAELGIAFPLLNPSLTTMFKVEFLNGQRHSRLLRPDESTWIVPETETRAGVARDYSLLGIRHIWGGIDHLLFVTCLLFVARTARRILITITGFTIAHSITLALAALEVVTVPVAPVEAAIALSILFLVAEIARGDRSSIAYRYPIAVSGSFGLLHGFGFAAVLTQIGLPQTELVTGLLFFNLGVEIGQILFVLTLVAVIFLVHGTTRVLHHARTTDEMMATVRTPAVYVIGPLAGFWLIDRIAAF